MVKFVGKSFEAQTAKFRTLTRDRRAQRGVRSFGFLSSWRVVYYLVCCRIFSFFGVGSSAIREESVTESNVHVYTEVLLC